MMKMKSSQKRVIDIKKNIPEKKVVVIKKLKSDKMTRFKPKEEVIENENEDDDDGDVKKDIIQPPDHTNNPSAVIDKIEKKLDFNESEMNELRETNEKNNYEIRKSEEIITFNSECQPIDMDCQEEKNKMDPKESLKDEIFEENVEFVKNLTVVGIPSLINGKGEIEKQEEENNIKIQENDNHLHKIEEEFNKFIEEDKNHEKIYDHNKIIIDDYGSSNSYNEVYDYNRQKLKHLYYLTREDQLQTIEEVKDSIIIPSEEKKKPQYNRKFSSVKIDKTTTSKEDKKFPIKKLTITKNSNKSSVLLNIKTLTENKLEKESKTNENLSQNPLKRSNSVAKELIETKTKSMKIFKTKKWDDKDMDPRLSEFKSKLKPLEIPTNQNKIEESDNEKGSLIPLKKIKQPLTAKPEVKKKEKKELSTKNFMTNSDYKTEVSNKVVKNKIAYSPKKNFKNKWKPGLIKKDKKEVVQPPPVEEPKKPPVHKKTKSFNPTLPKGNLLTPNIATCSGCKKYLVELISNKNYDKNLSIAKLMKQYDPNNCFFCFQKLAIDKDKDGEKEENSKDNTVKTNYTSNYLTQTNYISQNPKLNNKSSLIFSKTKNDWNSSDARVNSKLAFQSLTKSYVTNFNT